MLAVLPTLPVTVYGSSIAYRFTAVPLPTHWLTYTFSWFLHARLPHCLTLPVYYTCLTHVLATCVTCCCLPGSRGSHGVHWTRSWFNVVTRCHFAPRTRVLLHAVWFTCVLPGSRFLRTVTVTPHYTPHTRWLRFLPVTYHLRFFTCGSLHQTVLLYTPLYLQFSHAACHLPRLPVTAATRRTLPPLNTLHTSHKDLTSRRPPLYGSLLRLHRCRSPALDYFTHRVVRFVLAFVPAVRVHTDFAFRLTTDFTTVCYALATRAAPRSLLTVRHATCVFHAVVLPTVLCLFILVHAHAFAVLVAHPQRVTYGFVRVTVYRVRARVPRLLPHTRCHCCTRHHSTHRGLPTGCTLHAVWLLFPGSVRTVWLRFRHDTLRVSHVCRSFAHTAHARHSRLVGLVTCCCCHAVTAPRLVWFCRTVLRVGCGYHCSSTPLLGCVTTGYCHAHRSFYTRSTVYAQFTGCAFPVLQFYRCLPTIGYSVPS